MQSPLRSLFIVLFISFICPVNFSRAQSNSSTLVSRQTTNTLFQLNESSTASYNLLLSTSSKIKSEIRKTNDGYELIISAYKVSNFDPFVGLKNKNLDSSSNLVKEISIKRSPGQLNIRIITDSLIEPRISISEDQNTISTISNKPKTHYNHYIDFIAYKSQNSIHTSQAHKS